MAKMGKMMNKFWRRVFLFPLFVMMGIPDGDGGVTDPPPAADPPAADPPAGDPPPADDAAAATAKAEEDRRAALTDEERAVEDKAKADEEAKSKGAPDAYGDFKLPEGAIALDAKVLEGYLPLFKELNLSQDGAQKLIDQFAKTEAARVTNQWEDIKNSWTEQAKADPEIGGVNFDKNLAIAKRAINTFATPELEETLAQYGMDRNPEMIRLFYSIGLQIKEDDKFIGSNNETGENDAAQRIKNLYPNSYK